MAELLYIESSPRNEFSVSIKIARAFMEAYKKANPGDSIKTLKLFEMDLPPFDGFTIASKYKILRGSAPTTLEEKKAWSRVEALIYEFKHADKYLFAVPMWNFGIPYRLKHYIDILVQPGYTFRVANGGYEGLLFGKRAMAIYARGGQYPQGTPAAAFEMQQRYLEMILQFMGIQDIRSILAESTLGGGLEAEQKAAREGIAQVEMMVNGF
ncbi:MAG: NAD(P)H-dependent oxidoreductase [Planctomycetaceae bacterium]|nr:NAD(P)H-dependent oxidoreductase [Planctomycetaceae bacterium]